MVFESIDWCAVGVKHVHGNGGPISIFKCKADGADRTETAAGSPAHFCNGLGIVLSHRNILFLYHLKLEFFGVAAPVGAAKFKIMGFRFQCSVL
jgi:hypothetical protein